MRSITQIVKQFKQNWIKELDDDSIANACRDAGMTWLDSMLNPVVTVQIFSDSDFARQHGLPTHASSM